jgi:hypothetical protein
MKRKQLKWWKNLFFTFVMAIVNTDQQRKSENSCLAFPCRRFEKEKGATLAQNDVSQAASI